MEEENTVMAENTADDTSVSTSPVDETNTTTDVETEVQEAPTESQDVETDTEVDRKPTRAERRIRQLSEQNKQLRMQPNQFNPSFAQPPQFEVQPGQELSVEDYQKHVAQAGQAAASQVAEQLRNEFNTKEALRNFDSDLDLIETKYSELKEGTDDYIPELEVEIEKEFKQKAYRLTGFDPITNQPMYAIDPSVRLADIAAEKVALARAIATKSSAATRNAVATQADETALKPSGAAVSEKPFSDLSIAEMEQRLGMVRN